MRNNLSLVMPGLLFLAIACAGCAGEDDGPGDGFVELPPPDPACPEPTSVLPNEWRPITAVSEGEVTSTGEQVAVIDATAGGPPNAADRPYIYVSLSGSSIEKVALSDVDARRNVLWDLAFKRAVIRSNSGDSGPGDVRVAVVGASSLDDVTELPAADQFREDDWVSDDCEYNAGQIGEPATAIGTWYDYDVDTNRLAPSEVVYVLERPDGSAVKLAIRSYYDDEGTSGHYEIAWADM